MAIGMGPEVGDAYIEVHADTDAFRRELRGRMAAEMRKFSKTAGRTMSKEMDLLNRSNAVRFRQELANISNSGDWGRIRNQFGGVADWGELAQEQLERLRSTVVNIYEDGKKVGEKPFFKPGQFEELSKSLRNYKTLLKADDDLRAITRRNREWTQTLRTTQRVTEQTRMVKDELLDLERRVRLEQQKSSGNRSKEWEAYVQTVKQGLAEIDRLEKRDFEARQREMADRLKVVTRENDARLFQVRQLQSMTEQARRWGEEMRRQVREATEEEREYLGIRREEWDRYVNHLRRQVLGFDAVERRLRAKAERDQEASLRRGQTRYSVFFDKMKGSRSEFIHAIAVMMDAISTAVGRTFDGIVKIAGYFKPGGGGFGAMFSDLGSAAASLGKNWQAILITVGAIASSMAAMGALSGILISLASGLSAIIVGIVSSLGMALMSLVPMVGVLAGIGYGAGLLVAAFKDMDRYLPGVSGALDELKRVFSDVDVPAFAAGVAGPLKGLLSDLAASLENDQVAGALGKAFGSIIESLNGVINSAGWKSFMTALETTIPNAIAGFGGGLAGVFEGLFSAFGAGGPAVEKMGAAFQTFGQTFAKTMEDMDKSGRLDEFFSLAADSMIVVSDLAWSVGEALMGLFEAAGPAGNEMLEDITGLVKQFTEWVTSTEGKNEIAEWMEFGREVASKLWDIVKQVGTELKRLDTPQNRKWALSMLNLIRGIVHGIGNFIELAGKAATAYETAVNGVTDFFKGIGSVIGGVGDWFGQVWQDITDWWNSVSWDTLGSDIWQGFLDGVSAMWTGFVDQVRSMFEPFFTAVKEVLGIASPSTVFAGFGKDVVAGFRQGIEDAWAAFTTWVSGVFTGLKDTAKKAWETLQKDTTEKWTAITTVVREKAEAIRADLAAKWETIRSNVATKVEAVRSAVATKWEEIRSSVASKVEAVRALISSKWETIRLNVIEKWNQIKSAITNKWEEIKSGTSTKITEVVAIVAGLPGKAAGALKYVGKSLWQHGVDLIGGFLEGMKFKITSVVEAARSMASQVVTAVEKRLEIKSPSKVFERLGRFTALGFQEGVDRQQAAVQASLARMVTPPNINVPGLGGNIAGAQAYSNSRTVNVAPGAIQINTRAANPRIVAGMVLDDMASRMMGV